MISFVGMLCVHRAVLYSETLSWSHGAALDCDQSFLCCIKFIAIAELELALTDSFTFHCCDLLGQASMNLLFELHYTNQILIISS